MRKWILHFLAIFLAFAWLACRENDVDDRDASGEYSDAINQMNNGCDLSMDGSKDVGYMLNLASCEISGEAVIDGDAGLIPTRCVQQLLGGNSLWANLFASAAGALMYFATLTAAPILDGLLGAGMDPGPALSLPNMIVLHGVLGTKKSLAYFGLVIVMSALAGMLYGVLVAC